jgi:hypothetical protein
MQSAIRRRFASSKSCVSLSARDFVFEPTPLEKGRRRQLARESSAGQFRIFNSNVAVLVMLPLWAIRVTG